MILGAITLKPRKIEIVDGRVGFPVSVVSCNFWHRDSERILTLYGKSSAASRLIPTAVYYGVTSVKEQGEI